MLGFTDKRIYLCLSISLAASFWACDSTITKDRPQPVKLVISDCFNGDDTALSSVCSERVYQAREQAMKACLVVIVDGGPDARLFKLDFSSDIISGAARELTLDPGRRVQARMLFFSDTNWVDEECRPGGSLEVQQECTGDCILGLTSDTIVLGEGTELSFRSSDDLCRFQWPEGSTPPEDCNGSDDDCDGIVDEVAEIDRLCFAGIGGCEQAGARDCNAGQWSQCDATPGMPTPEIEGGDDEDCDGRVDEELASCGAVGERQLCLSEPGGNGACAEAYRTCLEGGMWSPCTGSDGAPVGEDEFV